MAFQNNTPERLVLGDEAGSHIVLDSGLNAIQLWVGNTIVGEWTAPDNQFDLAFRLAVAGDTDARFYIRGDGALFWGPGNAGQDVFLERGGPLMLQVTQNLNVVGNLSYGGRLENPQGNPAFPLMDSFQANASGAIAFPNSAAATTPTLVPGCSGSFTVTKTDNLVEIRPEFQCRNTNFGGVAFVLQLYVDGVPDPVSIPYQPSAANARVLQSRTYTFQNLSPGAHTFEMYANLSANPGVTGYSIETTVSTLVGKLFE